MSRLILPPRLSIVTGAGSGIGKAVACRLSEGGPVLAIGRSTSKLTSTARESDGQVIPLAMDVSDRAAIRSLGEALKDQAVTVKALVNNAGFARSGSSELPIDELEANWDAVIATNLTAPFLLSMAMAPFFERPGGRIVNISSIAAYSGGRNKGSAVYAASKAGLHGLSAGLAREFSDEGITVNTVAPGLIVETEFTANWPQSRIDTFTAEIPVGRPGQADEVAATVAFLCSPAAGYITGEVINQNGGHRFGG